MADHTVGDRIDQLNRDQENRDRVLQRGASVLDVSAPELPSATDIISIPTDAIDPGLLSALMPIEPICPKILGVKFPEATDLLSELAAQASSATDRLANSVTNAALDMAAQAEADLAAEFDNLSEGFTDLEAVMEAISSGAVDVSSLGVDVLSLPGAALGAAFKGFKKASDCLLGEPGSPEESFNAKAGKLDEGLAEGNGLSATASDEAITSLYEDAIDETGIKIKKQKTISVKNAISSIKGTTKTAVPQSEKPLAVYQYVSRI